MKSLMRIQLGPNGDVPDFLLGGDGGEQHMKDVLWPGPDPLHADSLESAAEKQICGRNCPHVQMWHFEEICVRLKMKHSLVT